MKKRNKIEEKNKIELFWDSFFSIVIGTLGLLAIFILSMMLVFVIKNLF